MVVEGELSNDLMCMLHGMNVTLLTVPPLEYPNTYQPRYSKNYLKLRAWEFEQYDGVLLVDSDLVVLGDVAPLFRLPTQFAAVWDQSRWLNRCAWAFTPSNLHRWLFRTLHSFMDCSAYRCRYRAVLQSINGGMLLVRPCAAVAQHMQDLMRHWPKLRFTHSTAEQAFLSW
jgi:hypothetical protein